MRLIKIDDLENLQLSPPILEADAPPYAILSHTWGNSEDELSFQDMVNISHHRHKMGFHKIRSFCARARQDGYQYAWADTVCIDKSSSAELSEAINSMYKWYSKSAVCYVFLEDLPSKNTTVSRFDLGKCRWFTRGWTLQELIAPEHVIFFNKSWEIVGLARDIASDISKITGIDHGTLLGASVKRISIARRMSWASRRITSRPEDLAYCLLGIFGINMPMLYGEGERAFIRLQQEIIRISNDQSIFAWSADETLGPPKSGYWSLLAPSPAYFKDSYKYVPIRGLGQSVEHSVTSGGIFLEALTNTSGTRLTLNCRIAEEPILCTIPIVRLRSGYNEHARKYDPFVLSRAYFDEAKKMSKKMRIFVRTDIHEADFETQHLINYIEIIRQPSTRSGYSISKFHPSSSYDPESGIILASPFPNTFCGAILCFEHRTNTRPPFIITLFTDYQPGEDDCISHDVTGVYSGISFVDFFAQFEIWIKNGRYSDLPGLVRHERLNTWRLDHSTFVRVSVRRESRYKIDSIAVAEIIVGASWEEVGA
jgi:hypothetical protein